MASKIKKFILPVLIVYAAFLVQSIILENVRIASSSPNLLIAVIILISIGADPLCSVFAGAFAGVLTDALCSRLFGIHILAYMYLAVMVSLTVDRKISNSPVLTAWACFIYTALFQLVYALAYIIVGVGADGGKIISSVLVRALFSAVVAIPTVIMQEKIRSRKNNAQQEGSDRI